MNSTIYVKLQLTSDARTCRAKLPMWWLEYEMILGTMQFQLPPGIISIDLTSNHGKVNILTNKRPICFHCDTCSILCCKHACSCTISRGKRWYCCHCCRLCESWGHSSRKSALLLRWLARFLINDIGCLQPWNSYFVFNEWRFFFFLGYVYEWRFVSNRNKIYTGQLCITEL